MRVDSERALDFIIESNRIEGILREPTEQEIAGYENFMELPKITVTDMVKFVSLYQPDAELRDRKGLNVYIGNHVPPAGDITIRTRLEDILNDANKGANAFEIHQRYEHLHPFTDGNGRSGRMLWWWQTGGESKIGFLHAWYYQSLQNWRAK
jgi:hypothetical protein